MPAVTRTSEFRSCVESIRLRTQSSAPSSRPASGSRKRGGPGETVKARSEFARQAAGIARELEATMAKLEKLAELAKRKTLFDDRPIEIQELSYIIKQSIATLNSKVSNLQSLGSQTSGETKGREHNQNVVTMLQRRLANASIGFKDVLELRTQNMKATRERTEQLGMARTSSTPSGGDAMNAWPGQKQGLRARRSSTSSESTAAKNDYLTLDMGDMQQQQYEEQALMGGGHVEARSRAIESIESTIGELGQIFSDLSQMVAVQGEQVQRIDADVGDIESNVGGAQRELLKTLAAATSNRALMLKVFGVVIAFFLLFVLVS